MGLYCRYGLIELIYNRKSWILNVGGAVETLEILRGSAADPSKPSFYGNQIFDGSTTIIPRYYIYEFVLDTEVLQHQPPMNGLTWGPKLTIKGKNQHFVV